MSIETPGMTAEEARAFDHFSVHNAVRAQQACPEGTCEAYRDIFTYRRWRAQGYQVERGQKGTRVLTWLTTTTSDENGDPITVRHAKRTVGVLPPPGDPGPITARGQSKNWTSWPESA